MTLLKTVGLCRYFGGLKALDGVDLTVQAGEIVGVIGPNGSGKTTFFNAVSGIYPPSAGHVELAGQNLTGLGPAAIARAGITRTFQTSRPFPGLTVLENVLVGRHTHLKAGLFGDIFRPRWVREEETRAIAHARTLLALFGDRLLPYAERPAGSLSYANRRRLEIARALAVEPKLLLLDEPAAGMDPVETAELVADIRRIHARGVTILIIEHDMELMAGLPDRVVVLESGRKIAEGPFEVVRRAPAVIEAYLGKGAIAHAGG